MDAGEVDRPVLNAVGDQVAVLDEGDGAACGSFGADVANGRAAGRAGETAVRDERHRAVDPLVADNGLGGHQHLRHTAAAGAFIADNDDLAGIDLIVDHGIVGVLLVVEHAGLGIDDFALIHGAGGILQHAAFGGNIALQDRHRAFFGSLFHGEDHLIALQAIVVQVAQIALEPVVLMQILQIFTQRLAGDGHHVQIQHIPQHPLHHGNAAGEPEGFRQLRAGGIDVAQMRHLMVDLVKQLNGEIIPQLSGDGGQMNGGVGGTADGAVNDDGVAESRRRHDLRDRDVLLHQLHDLPAGIAGILQNVPHGSRHQRSAGQRHAQSLCHALHGGSGAKEGAGAHRGAAGQLIVPHFLLGDGVLALLTQGDIAGNQRGGHIGAGTHGTAGHEDCGDVHTGGSLQVCGDGLIAAGSEDHAVPRHGRRVDFHHVGNGFAGSQNNVHAVVTLRAAVADIRGIVLGRLAAGLIDAVHRLLHHLVEVGAAGMRVTIHAFDHDLGLQDIRIVPAAAHFQRIKLRPQHPIIMAFLNHRDFSSILGTLKFKIAKQSAACHTASSRPLLYR